MNIQIRYISRSGNTQKVAKTIAKELQVEAKDASIPLDDKADILLLGSALYAFQIDQDMLNFIKTLSKENVTKVYCFSTSALLTSSYNTLNKALQKQGLTLETFEFHCRGKFGALHADRPNKSDLKRAGEFARKIRKSNQ